MDATIAAALAAHALDVPALDAGPGCAPDGSGAAGSAADLRSAAEAEYRAAPSLTVRLVAEQLARVHDVAAPPQVARLDVDEVLRLAGTGGAARREGAAAYRHVARARLVELLRDRAPSSTDAAVLTHGRPTLSRLRCRRDAALGFVDWTHAAWADPHRDLARACADLAEQLGPATVPEFIEAYRGLRPHQRVDPLLVDWWAIAAELGV